MSRLITLCFFLLVSLQAATATVALLGRGEAGQNLADRKNSLVLYWHNEN